MLRKELLALRAEEQQLRRRYRELAAAEDRLEQLHADYLEAQAAEVQLEQLQDAETLCAQQPQLEASQRTLANMPAALARFHGDELERLAEFRTTLGQQQQQRTEIERSLRDCETVLEASGLNLENCELKMVQEWSQRSARLVEREERAQALSVQLAATQQLAQEQGELLLGDEGAPLEPLGQDQLAELERFLSESLQLEARQAAVAEELKHLGEAALPTEAQSWRAAAVHLTSWLHSAAATSNSGGRWASFWLPFGLVLGGVLAAFLLEPLLLAIAGLGLGYLFANGWRSHRSANEQASARRRYEELGLEQPSNWSLAAVQQQLSELQRSVADAEQLHAAAERRSKLVARQTELEQRSVGLFAEARRWKTRTGLSWRGGSLAIVEAARRLNLHRNSRSRLTELSHALQQLRDENTAELREACAFLKLWGIDAAAIEAGPRLQASLGELEIRLNEHHRALQAQTQLQAELSRLAEQHQIASNQLARLFESLDLEAGDEQGLRALSQQEPAYTELAKRIEAQEVTHAELRQRLATKPSWMNMDEEQLGQLRSQLEILAKSREQRLEQWQRVKLELEQARAGNQLEELRAARRMKEDGLLALKQEAVHAEATHFLLEDIELSYEKTSRPTVLQHAMDLFADFTRGAFHLQATALSAGTIKGICNSSGQPLSLGQLSDGTRVQLLLALRLAFAEVHGGDNQLPIFLDESLSTADPKRFEAIATVVLDRVKSGQQVFYLSSNPLDQAIWEQLCLDRGLQPPHIVRLQEGQNKARQRISISPWLSEATNQPPAPGDSTMAEYAATLDLSPPDRHAPAEQLDLFFVASDSLEAVYQLRCRGISTVGQFARLLDRSVLTDYLPSAQDRQMLKARKRMAESYLRNWRIGRGRPLSRPQLDASNAVSQTFLESIAERLHTVGGSADALLRSLQDRPVRRFGPAAQGRLRGFLEERGFVDERSVLEPFELELELVEKLRNELNEGDLSVETIRSFITFMDDVCSTGTKPETVRTTASQAPPTPQP
tara:strand:+ start:227 stop:3271 length:3045 start_codon:yes stop_codon:yes gene_type:complete